MLNLVTKNRILHCISSEMKDADPKELKQVYIQTVDYAPNDEVNLVNFAKIIIQRKILILITIILIVGPATAVIFFKPQTYTYTTSIEIGAQIVDGNIQPLEPPQALLAKINKIFIPLALNKQRLLNPNDTKLYVIKVDIPKDSLIIIAEMQGSENEVDVIKNLLQDINQKSVQSQSLIYESIKQYTQSRLDQTSAELRLLKDTNGNETEIALQLSLIDTFTSQLATLRNTREILPVTQSLVPAGLSQTLMLTITIITSVLLGIFSAFFAEFIAKVKEA